MKEILKITISLTAVCLVAALILGVVFAKTDHARKEVAEQIEQEAIQGLLGFGHGKKAPDDLKVYPVYRYVLNDPSGATLLGYLLPVKDKKYVLTEVDLAGKALKVIPISADASKLVDQSSRDLIVKMPSPRATRPRMRTLQTLRISERSVSGMWLRVRLKVSRNQ